MRTSALGSRLIITLMVMLAATGLVTVAPSSPAAAAVDDHDWLGAVNSYRAMSGLGPLVENPTWSDGARLHSRYMLLNGISHNEVSGRPGYTDAGHAAGMNGNVAVSSSVSATPRSHIDLWMTGPFHAIGVLRHNLTSTGFGIAADPDTSPWRSGATLDVIRGIGTSPRPEVPIVFPGRDATVPLYRFVSEQPNPVSLCGWSGAAGLPLIAMMPAAVSAANATLTGPNGPVETCTLHPGNTSDATARGVMQSENAVVVVPRDHLATGSYTATVTSNGGQTTWSFNVDPNAPLPSASAPPPAQPQPAQQTVESPKPTTTTIGEESVFEPIDPYRHADSRDGLRVVRLTAGQITPVEIATGAVTAVSANFTIAGQSAPGHLSVFNCSPALPDVSTVNFDSSPAANQAIVPLSSGRLCLYSSADTHVIIDVNGLFRPSGDGTTTFRPQSPSRPYDTRNPGVPRLAPGEVRRVPMRGVTGGAPADATAVAINLTAVDPSAGGWLRAFPCGNASQVSNVNFGPGEARPNSAVVRLSAAGDICLQSDVALDLIIDRGGAFSASGGLSFTALAPLRVLDTRSNSTGLNPLTTATPLAADQVYALELAGSYGIPADAKGVAINVTVVGPPAAGYLTVFPCGTVPASSNLNFRTADLAIANGAMVGLNPGGEICVVADQPVHLLIDISGAWR
ncbi:hypothetical protein BH23ACT3_BH23ACT3_13780 [soil metagenome]